MELEIEQRQDLTTIYFPSSHLDDVVHVLGGKFRIKPVTDDIYEIFNVMRDFFGRVIGENNYNSRIELLNLPFDEIVEKDIKGIEGMLKDYSKQLIRDKRIKQVKGYFHNFIIFLDEMCDAGMEKFKVNNNPAKTPNITYFLYGVAKYIGSRKRSK